MANYTMVKEEVTVAPTLRNDMLDLIGAVMHKEYPDATVQQIKIPNTPIMLLVSADDCDYTITVTAKKERIDESEMDVLAEYGDESEVE